MPPDAHAVQPVHPWPPHWPYRVCAHEEEDGVVEDVAVVVVVVVVVLDALVDEADDVDKVVAVVEEEEEEDEDDEPSPPPGEPTFAQTTPKTKGWVQGQRENIAPITQTGRATHTTGR